MTERAKIIPERVFSIGSIEYKGSIVQRDLELIYFGKRYVLSVSTQEYLDLLKIYNLTLPDEQKLDENILVLPNVELIGKVVTEISEIEFKNLTPYLAEQLEQEAR